MAIAETTDGFSPRVDGAGRERPGGVHQVGHAADARQRLLDAFETTDRRVELLADRRVGAHHPRRQLGGADGESGQRDRAAGGEALHQHAPALAGPFAAADDEVERHEDIGARVRTVVERDAHRVVPLSDVDSGKPRWNQRARDPQVVTLTDQVIGIVHFECQADQRGDGTERDVALAPVEAHAEHLPPLVGAPAHDTRALRGGRVAARLGAGEREARDLLTAGKARQQAVLLLLGSVVEQQLGRTERVGHHDRHRRGDAATRQL